MVEITGVHINDVKAHTKIRSVRIDDQLPWGRPWSRLRIDWDVIHPTRHDERGYVGVDILLESMSASGMADVLENMAREIRANLLKHNAS